MKNAVSFSSEYGRKPAQLRVFAAKQQLLRLLNCYSIIINESGRSELTDEENEIITLVLNGNSCVEIAKQYEVEVDVISGLLEVIRAKLSLIEK